MLWRAGWHRYYGDAGMNELPKRRIIPEQAKDHFAPVAMDGPHMDPLPSDLIPVEMKLRAIWYRQMAATATTAQVSEPLRLLAEQYEQVAVETAGKGTMLGWGTCCRMKSD